SRASGVLVYGISNRGGRALGFGNIGVTPSNPAGDGFDQRTGNVYLASGWQADLGFNPDSNAETIRVPVARNPHGPAVTTRTVARLVRRAGNVNTLSLPGRGRTPASLDTTQATLVSIEHESNVGVRTGVVTIPSGDWAFADCRTTPFPGAPDPTRI